MKIFAFMLAFSLSQVGLSTVLYVDDDSPENGDGQTWATAFNNLRDALNTANEDSNVSEVRVGAGIYYADEGEDVFIGDSSASFFIRSGLTVTGGYAGVGKSNPNLLDPVQYQSILDGDLLENDISNDYLSRFDNTQTMVTFTNDTPNQPTTIYGFTFRRPQRGIFFDSGANGFSYPLLISNCAFEKIGAGAIPDKPAKPVSGSFSGIRLQTDANSPITIIQCTFNELRGAAGGAQAPISIERSSNNIGSVPTTIRDCTFTNNFYRGGAGAIHTEHNSVNVIGCFFDSNRVITAQGKSGAIHASDEVSDVEMELRVISSLFTNNVCNTGGAAINCKDVNAYVANSVFDSNITYPNGNNSATIRSRKFDDEPIALDIRGCTITRNVNNAVAGLVVDVYIGNTIVYNNPGGTEIDVTANQSGGSLTVEYSVVNQSIDQPTAYTFDPLLSSKTIYLLSADSPCIDAGSNTVACNGQGLLDYLGNTRFFDDANTQDTGEGTSNIVDIGAVEFDSSTIPFCIADINGDCFVDSSDLASLLASWGTSDTDLDANGVVDSSDLAILLAAWGSCF